MREHTCSVNHSDCNAFEDGVFENLCPGQICTMNSQCDSCCCDNGICSSAPHDCVENWMPYVLVILFFVFILILLTIYLILRS